MKRNLKSDERSIWCSCCLSNSLFCFCFLPLCFTVVINISLSSFIYSAWSNLRQDVFSYMNDNVISTYLSFWGRFRVIGCQLTSIYVFRCLVPRVYMFTKRTFVQYIITKDTCYHENWLQWIVEQLISAKNKQYSKITSHMYLLWLLNEVQV